MSGPALPRCNCANCQRWVAYLAAPAAVLTADEIQKRNAAYEAHRAAWLTNNPRITRDQIALLEGGE